MINSVRANRSLFLKEIGFLKELMEEMPVAIGIANYDKRSATVPLSESILYYNRRWREIFGFNEGDIMTVREAIERLYPDPSYRDKMLKKRNDAIKAALERAGPVEPFEARIRTADGRIRIFLTGTSILEGRMVVSMEDVTHFGGSKRSDFGSIPLYRSGSDHLVVGLESIAAVVADGKHSKVLSGSTLIPDHRGIGCWEKFLSGGGFERVDRSTLVRMGWIHALQSVGRGGRISFAHAAVCLDVGRKARERILKVLDS